MRVFPFSMASSLFDRALWDRYFARECTPEERKRVEEYLAADSVRAAAIAELRVALGIPAGALEAIPEPRDVGILWQELRARTLVPPQVGPDLHVAHDDRRPQGVGGGVGAVGRWRAAATVVAVVVALGIGLALGGGGQHRAGSNAAAGREYATAAGQRLSVTLVDGTQLTLAPASRVQLAADYGVRTRELSLNGEAVFTVVHDGARPFRVRARKVVTEDVGTRFGVRAYGTDSSVRVVVADGAVALADAGHRPWPAAAAQTTQLSAGDVAVVYTAGHVGIMRHVELEPYFAWTEGRLVFENTPLPDVANALARWYGVRVEIGDATLRRRHLTLTLTPQALDAALGIIVPVAGARAERRGNAYVLLTNTQWGHP
jgi:transmembrane sensor